jgi:hypothetical protein
MIAPPIEIVRYSLSENLPYIFDYYEGKSTHFGTVDKINITGSTYQLFSSPTTQ